MDCICTYKDGLFSRKGVKDDVIKMIDLIVCGRKDGAFEEELVLSVGLIYIWINGIDQTLNVVLREMHVVGKLNGFVWGEI
jgi:hypothetical protein